MTRLDGIALGDTGITIHGRRDFACENQKSWVGSTRSANEAPILCKADGGIRSEERFFALGGHDNPLKRPNSDKKIQGNPSFFLGKIWLKLGLAWPGFDKFGLGLEEPA